MSIISGTVRQVLTHLCSLRIARFFMYSFSFLLGYSPSTFFMRMSLFRKVWYFSAIFSAIFFKISFLPFSRSRCPSFLVHILPKKVSLCIVKHEFSPVRYQTRSLQLSTFSPVFSPFSFNFFAPLCIYRPEESTVEHVDCYRRILIFLHLPLCLFHCCGLWINWSLPLHDYLLLFSCVSIVELFSVFGNNEIIVFCSYKKRWNVCFFDMFAQRVQSGNLKVVLDKVIVTFYLIVLEMKESAIPEKKDMTPLVNRYASSLQSF